MSLYKHMHKLAAARDDEGRPIAERVIAVPFVNHPGFQESCQKIPGQTIAFVIT